MTLWYRVFGTGDGQPEPAALLGHLVRGLGVEVRGKFRGDDLGWFGAELLVPGEATAVNLERYLVSEEGIRADLNTWAAWLETRDGELMQHVVRTQQLFTVERPADCDDEDMVELLCLELCLLLARETTGVYQIDGRGFFDADGMLLLEETE
jgi:hypothetical protein